MASLTSEPQPMKPTKLLMEEPYADGASHVVALSDDDGAQHFTVKVEASNEAAEVQVEAVALELHILHTDHHEARLNIDLRYSVHKDPPFCPKGGLQQYKNIQVSCKNSGSIFSRAMD